MSSWVVVTIGLSRIGVDGKFGAPRILPRSMRSRSFSFGGCQAGGLALELEPAQLICG